jgi:hypothetical protein
MSERGLLLAVDEAQEWLLPWWWSNYSRYNDFPVAIVDLGMSASARAWCAAHGTVLDFAFPKNFVAPREKIEKSLEELWSAHLEPEMWQSRGAWFKKPFSMLQSAFEVTLWLDLDCEILGPLRPLFDLFPKDQEIAIAREPILRQGHPTALFQETIYNSGVILFRRGAALIQKWAEKSAEENHCFWGDQQVLSRIIFEQNFSVFEIPDRYNFQLHSGIPINVTIIHWIGAWGKEFIRKHGGLRKELEASF